MACAATSPCEWQDDFRHRSSSIPVSNRQNSFVSEALADGLLQQLVCLLIHTGCGLIDAQHLPGTDSEGSSQASQQTPLPA